MLDRLLQVLDESEKKKKKVSSALVSLTLFSSVRRVNLLARRYDPLGRLRVAAQLRVLVPLTLATGLRAVTPDLPPAAFDACIRGRYSPRSGRPRRLCGLSRTISTGRLESHGTLKGMKHDDGTKGMGARGGREASVIPRADSSLQLQALAAGKTLSGGEKAGAAEQCFPVVSRVRRSDGGVYAIKGTLRHGEPVEENSSGDGSGARGRRKKKRNWACGSRCE